MRIFDLAAFSKPVVLMATCIVGLQKQDYPCAVLPVLCFCVSFEHQQKLVEPPNTTATTTTSTTATATSITNQSLLFVLFKAGKTKIKYLNMKNVTSVLRVQFT